MWNTPVHTVQIEVPRRLFRAMHWRPLNYAVVALTGVSVSFCPFFLYLLGRGGAAVTDWRVLANFAVIFLVPGVYMSFGAPVVARAWKPWNDSAPGTDEESGTRTAKGEMRFWLLVVGIGLVIWLVSDWLVR